MSLSALLAGFTTGAGLIIAIGSQNAFVLRQGLLRQHVGVLVLITSLSDILLISLGVAGMGALIQQLPSLLAFFQYGGALFLAWYGVSAAKRAWRGTEVLEASENSTTSLRKAVLTCLAFTFLNPHVYLDTMVLLGSLSTHYSGDGRTAFGLGACLASIVWFVCLGYGARLLRPIFNNPNAWRLLDGVIAVIMLGLSVVMLTSQL